MPFNYGGCVSLEDKAFYCEARRLGDNILMARLQGFEDGKGGGWITWVEALEPHKGKGAGSSVISSLKQNFINGYGESSVCIKAAAEPGTSGFYEKNDFKKAGYNDGGNQFYQWGNGCIQPRKPVFK
jgi:hypothetical protein